MIRKILYAAIAAGIIGGAYAYYLWNKPAIKTADRSVDVTVAATILVSQYSDSLYLGKTIDVKGKIATIETENGITNISFETADPMVSVSCEMEKGSENPSAKIGDEVTLRGQCAGKLADVVLTNCILVKK